MVTISQIALLTMLYSMKREILAFNIWEIPTKWKRQSDG